MEKEGYRREKVNWFREHVDTIVILSSFAVCFWTLNEKINNLDKDVAIIKTVMMMKGIMPQEMCYEKQNEVKQ